MPTAVEFHNVSRHFGKVRAVDAVSVSIAEGEFFAMLGPSGSGKTTCLRLIAGFEQPTHGDVALFGQSMNGVPPYRRAVNTVFQDYALFPHLNVRDNVAYGLMIAGMGRAERQAAAEAALNMVRMPNYGGRKPSELSGGQRQRVALARALVMKPRVLLLDEPLGALDLKLREQMQEELKELQRQLAITFVFVTHDQGEALSMADRVAVFNKGQIEQVGTPSEIYDKPATRFVADFVGSSNLLDPQMSRAAKGPDSWVSLRPEAISFCAADQGRINGHVHTTRFLGAGTRVTVATGAALPPDERGYVEPADWCHISVLLPAGKPVPRQGEAVGLDWDASAMHPIAGAR